MINDIFKAKEEYRKGSPEVKALLEKFFKKEDLKDESDWIELWKKFCNKHKLNLILPYPNPENHDEEYIDAQFMMMHIIRKNRSKKPDFNNFNENKYCPYFDMNTCSGSGYITWYSITDVGSRLCFPDDKKLMYEVVVEFLPIYEKIMIEP